MSNETQNATKAQPDRIWLQDGCTCSRYDGSCVCDPDADVYDAEVTWCRDQINPSDSEYLRATPERKVAGELLTLLRGMVRIVEAMRMSTGLGKSQIERLDAAKTLIARATGGGQ